MKAKCRARVRGTTLLEVMLAVFLTAVTALGVLAAQLWATRDARANAMREQALLIADAAIEARRPKSRDGAAAAAAIALQQWQTRAASLLPHGAVSMSSAGGDASIMQVTWDVHANLPHNGDLIDLPVPCGDVAVPANTGCVVLAFAE
jgi:Tfp pilus assembly protein PilV